MNKYLLFMLATLFGLLALVDALGANINTSSFAILGAIFFVGGMICDQIEQLKK